MVSPKSELAEKHPEWIVKSGKRDIIPMRNQWLLDLSNPEVQDFVVKTFDEVIALSPDISYIKWDATVMWTISVPNICPKKIRLISGLTIQRLVQCLRSDSCKTPGCSYSVVFFGWRPSDFGALKYHDEFWASDNTNSLDRIFIQYSTNLFFPAKATAAHVSTTRIIRRV